MDSLDVYVKKREERRRRLKTPVKRAAAFAAKLAGGQQQQQEMSASKLQKSLTKPAVFAPSILSTKQTNMNFSTMFKSPSVVASKTQFKPGQLRRSIIKENTSTTAQSAVNGSLLSTSTATAKRPMFHLKASLARPLTWTPLLVPILSRFGADINLTITLILNSWNFTADHVGGRKRRR